MIATWLVTAALALPGPPTSTCGDGVVEGAELCDDEGTEADDGCAADCLAVEEGWECTGAPSACFAICGDGLVRGEDCDDGNLVPDDGCSEACADEIGWSCDEEEPTTCVPSSRCGDSMVTGSEDCDDGNLVVDDGCDDTCSVEPRHHCDTPDGGGASVCLGDADEDTVVDEWDNCPNVANPSQRDEDDDGLGDKCEADDDGGCSTGGGGAGVGVLLAIVGLLTLRRRGFVA